MTHQCKGICKNGQQCKRTLLKAEYCKVHYKGDCSICLSDIHDCKSSKTPCGHFFHDKCLEQWLDNHNTCPICRTEIGEKQYTYEMRLTPSHSEPIAYQLVLSQNVDDSSSDDMISILVQHFIDMIQDDDAFNNIISNRESFEIRLSPDI